MTFKNKISNINSTQELVDFIKTIDSHVSFLHGRKFSYDKNSEKITYNQFISQIHFKLQNSKGFDGSRVSTELKQLNAIAEKQLSTANIFTRIFTYVKRLFNFFQREQKLKEIHQIKVTADQVKATVDQRLSEKSTVESAPKAANTTSTSPQTNQIDPAQDSSTKSTLAYKEQLDVISTLQEAKVKMKEDPASSLNLNPIESLRAKVRFPSKSSNAARNPSPVDLAKKKFNKIIEDKFIDALKQNRLSTAFKFNPYISKNLEDINIEILLLKPDSETHHKVKGKFYIVATIPTGRIHKSEKDYPNTMKYELHYSFLNDTSENTSSEKILQDIDATINRSVTYLRELNLILNDNLLLENENHFFSPSKCVEFVSLGVWPINLKFGQSDNTIVYATVNLLDEHKRKLNYEISFALDLSGPPNPNIIAAVIKDRAIKEFDLKMKQSSNPREKSFNWNHAFKDSQDLSAQTMDFAFSSLVNLMEKPELKDLYKNNDKEAIEHILSKKNIHKAFLKFHPDKNPEKGGAKFIELKECLRQAQNWLKAN